MAYTPVGPSVPGITGLTYSPGLNHAVFEDLFPTKPTYMGGTPFSASMRGTRYSALGGGGGAPFTASTQRNPDFERVGQTAQSWYRSVDPTTRARQAMGLARELGVGLTAEARAGEARRGVSESGVSSLADRSIAGRVAREANKAGQEAYNKGQELQLGGIGALTNVASGQSESQDRDLDRMMKQYELQQQQALAQQEMKLKQLQTMMQLAQATGAGGGGGGGGGGVGEGGGGYRAVGGALGSGNWGRGRGRGRGTTFGSRPTLGGSRAFGSLFG